MDKVPPEKIGSEKKLLTIVEPHPRQTARYSIGQEKKTHNREPGHQSVYYITSYIIYCHTYILYYTSYLHHIYIIYIYTHHIYIIYVIISNIISLYYIRIYIFVRNKHMDGYARIH